MKRILLLVCLVALLPLSALAQTPTPTATPTATPTVSETWPSVLIDQTCGDSYNVPAARTGGGIPPAVQVSGTGDDRCDHDSRIFTDAALVADTVFGPFQGSPTACFIIFADGNAVSGGDSGWGIAIQIVQPHDGVKETLDAAAEVNGVTDSVWMVGLPTGYSYTITEDLNVRLPGDWYLVLDLLGATSWLGEISMVGC